VIATATAAPENKRPTALFALTVTTPIGVTLVPAAATRRNRP
jgi:hypothetical protein